MTCRVLALALLVGCGGGLNLEANGYPVDVAEFDELVYDTAARWQSAFDARAIPCEAADFDGVSVRFVDSIPGRAGVFKDGLIDVVWRPVLAETALAHELSHAILWRCPRAIQDHAVMACLVKLEPAVGLPAQLRPDQCQ